MFSNIILYIESIATLPSEAKLSTQKDYWLDWCCYLLDQSWLKQELRKFLCSFDNIGILILHSIDYTRTYHQYTTILYYNASGPCGFYSFDNVVSFMLVDGRKSTIVMVETGGELRTLSTFIGRKKHSSNHSVTHETKCEMEDIHIKKYLSSLFSGTLTVLLLCCKCWIISVMITTVEKIWLNFSSIIHLKTSYVYVTVTLSHSFIFSFQKMLNFVLLFKSKISLCFVLLTSFLSFAN